MQHSHNPSDQSVRRNGGDTVLTHSYSCQLERTLQQQRVFVFVAEISERGSLTHTHIQINFYTMKLNHEELLSLLGMAKENEESWRKMLSLSCYLLLLQLIYIDK